MRYGWILILGVMLALPGCAPTPPAHSNDALTEAEQAVMSAKSSDAVSEYAPVELEKATEQLGAAKAAMTGDEEGGAEAAHLAYLAKRHAEIAMMTASAAEARAATEQLEKQREQLRLEKRSQQLSQRQQQVQQQQREIEMLRSQLSELNPKQTDRGIVLTIGNVLFGFDSAELNPSASDPLDKLGGFLREHTERRIRVEGYTDSVGSESYNQMLSERRAQSVADAMIDRGIEPGRMSVVGNGESSPVASNETEAGRQQNRRVEFVILDQ